MELNILVVDDEQDIRELVAGVLEDEGYATPSAADSRGALAAIADRKMVDQPPFSDPSRRQKSRGLPKSVQSFEAVGIGERDIVDAVEAAADGRRFGLGERFADIGAARDRLSRRVQRTRKDGRRRALFGREIGVAR